MENRAPQNMKKNDLLELINDKVSGIQTQYDEAKKLVNELEKNKKQVEHYFLEIQRQEKPVKKLFSEIQKQHDNIKNIGSKIQKWHDDSNTCISNIQEQKIEANKLIPEIQQQKNIADKDVSKIQEQQKLAVELTNKIKNQHETDSKIIKEKQAEYEQLNKKIESLLPGATSAGLAGSYHDAQKEEKTTMYWWGFIGSLLILMIIYVFILISKEISWTHIITRAIIGAPLLWIAWYCQRSISQTNRIKEEYHHKQRIMAVFDGFSKEIDRLTENNPDQNKEKKLELISAIINAISKNPAEKINPAETFLDSIQIKKKQDRGEQISEKEKE